MGDRSTGIRRRNVRISKGGVFQQEPQATGGTRRQVESPTAANGKKTFAQDTVLRAYFAQKYGQMTVCGDEGSRAARSRGLAHLGLDVYA